MKKFLLKSLALLLTLTFLLSAASLAISVAAASYISGVNKVSNSYSSGKYYQNLSKIPLSGNNRADVVAVALSQVRYREGTAGNYAGTNGDGVSNYTEYNYNYGSLGGYSYAWCAAFVTWSLRQSGINKVGTGVNNLGRSHLGNKNYIWAEASCGYWVSQLTQCGYFQISKYRGGTYTPKNGDIIFFENSTNYSWSDHVGLVVYVSGNTVYTIEGNTSSGTGLNGEGGGVYFKSYSLNSSRITGYGAMPYNSSSSPIDYSGANPTTGLYIGVTGTKYIYPSASSSSENIGKLPGGTVFEVTEVVGSGIGSSYLKVNYNGIEGYVANNTDRVIQLTQTSGGGNQGGNTGGGTTVTPGSAQFAAHVGALGIDGGALTTVNNMTANSGTLNEYAYNGSATTIDWQGWAMINGGQTESFVFSVDGGSTWKSATLSAKADGDPSIDSTLLILSGASSWANIGTAGASGYKSAHFIVHTDLSASAGKTVTVALGRKGSDGAVYTIAKITGVSVPAASQGGGTTTSTVYYGANLDEINGAGPGETVDGTQLSQSTHVFGASAASIKIKGWCAMKGGQDGIYYTKDGGTTWVSMGNGATSGDSAAILGAAQGKAGNTSDWGNDADYRFDLTADLSSYAGTTISTLTFGRKAAADGKIYPMFSLTNVSVPAAPQGGGSGSGGTTTVTPSTLHDSTTNPSIGTFHGAGDAAYNSGNTYANGYVTLTGHAAKFSLLGNVQRFLVVRYRTDANNTGRIWFLHYNPDQTIFENSAVKTNGNWAVKVFDMGTAVKAGFISIIANDGDTDGVTDISLVASFTSQADANAYANSLIGGSSSTPGGSGNTSTGNTSGGTITQVDVPAIHSCSWTTYTTNGAVAIKCTGCNKTVVPTEYLDPAEIFRGTNRTTTTSGGHMLNQGSYVTVGTLKTATGSTLTAGKSNMAAICDSYSINSGNAVAMSGATANQNIVNANTYGGSAQTVKFSGWAMVEGGQTATFYWSGDNGATWFPATTNSTTTPTAANYSAYNSSCQGLTGVAWGSYDYTGAHFAVTADISVYSGSTIDVTLGRMSSAGHIYKIGQLKNVTATGTASSGVTSNETIQYGGLSNMGRYLLIQYNTQANHSALGASSTLKATYFDIINNQHQWYTGAYNTSGNKTTMVIDMKESCGASATAGGNFAFVVDQNGKAAVNIYFMATFNDAYQVTLYNSIVSGGTCSHSEKIAATTAKAATCSSTGYTAGEKCAICGVVTQQPQKIEATSNHSWSADTCTGATRTCSGCGAQQPGSLGHSWSANTCPNGGMRTCSTCSSTQPGTLNHTDSNGDTFCDMCNTQVSSGSTGSAAPVDQAGYLAAVVNFINGVGPDGTDTSNYAAQLISTGTMVSSIPAPDIVHSANYITLSGWCILNGGQKNVIYYSTDGGVNWNGTCTETKFSDGGIDNRADLVQLAKDFVSMPNPSNTGAFFENAKVQISALGGASRVTFGREGNDGSIRPFAVLTDLPNASAVCSHSNCNISAATCDTAKVCNDCGAVITAALGHNIQTVAAKSATCTENGNSAGESCSRCDYTTVMTVPALGHKYNVVMTSKAATCTATGLTEGLQCACGDIKTPQTTIPALGHSYTYMWNTTQHWQKCSLCDDTTTAANHSFDANGTCSTCSYGCSHVAGPAATCTTAQICTKCDGELVPALGHNYEEAYSTNETHHWHKCLRSGCTSTSDYAEHVFESNKCICGVKKNSYPDFHSSVDWINGVGPNNDSTTPFTDKGGNTSKGTDSIAIPFNYSINYLKIQGWALAVGGITGYKWSVDGEVWNNCTYDSLSDASGAHISAASVSGITSSNTNAANAIFTGLCADISAYAGQTLDVTFAGVGAEGEIIPFATITGVKAGTPAKVNASFDEFHISGTSQGFNGFTSGIINGVTVSGADAATGALSMSNLSAGQSITLWGWIGYQAEVEYFGYYFNGYSNNVRFVANHTTSDVESSAIQAAGGQYARRMLIPVDTVSLSGTCTITFVAKFKDGTVTDITTWIATVSNSSATGSTGNISNQYANIIIIAGQSNAYGATPTDQSSYPIQQMYGTGNVSNNIKIHYRNINGSGSPLVSSDPVRVIRENSGFETYNVTIGGENDRRMGPEFGLAQYLKDNYTNNEKFYIVKFAAAGTFLNGDWFSGDAVGKQASKDRYLVDMGAYLYDQMLNYVANAIAKAEADSGLPAKVHSFLWVQGESDSGDQTMATNYQFYEQNLVNGVRAAFAGYAPQGGISFINYAIAETDSAGWFFPSTLNNSKRANAQYYIEAGSPYTLTEKPSYVLGKSVLINKTDWLSKKDVGYDTDQAHLEANSMTQLGLTMGAAVKAMDGKDVVHVHTPVTIPAVPATCTASGLTEGTKCSTCNHILIAQAIDPATGHSYDNDNDMNCNVCNELRPSENCSHSFTEGAYVNTNAEYHFNTCTLCGVELNRESHVFSASCDSDCNTCGYIREVSHNPITVALTPATCVSAGMGESQICQSCGKLITAGATIPKLSHSFTETVVVAPTCTTRGYTSHRCVNGCNISYNTNYVNATSHTYVPTVTNATCTEVGYTVYSCEKCGDFYATDYVNAKGHSYSASNVAPSCTENGYTLHSCSGCNSSYATNYVSATGHDYSATTVAGTCMSRGYTLYACSCGAQYKADFTEIIGHHFTVSITVTPTCSAIGYTVYACDRDGCDAEYRNDFTSATGHSYEIAESNGTTTKYVCTGGCGLFYVTVPEGMGHTHSYETTVIASSCTTDGYTKYICACGDEYVADHTAAKGHSYVANVVAATCTAGGYTTYRCSSCNDSYTANETPATGHQYTQTVVSPSCGVDGYTLYTCSCGHSYQGDFVTNDGHDLVVTSRVYPTLTTQGYTTYQCSSCGETEIGNILNYTDLVSSAYTGTTTPVARGIDVSYWQNGGYKDPAKCTPFPFAAAKAAGIDFVIIRAGTSSMKDPAFEMNYRDAKAAGLDVGVYYYTYSTTVEGAQNDANRLLGWLQGKQFEYPIYFDLEDEAQKGLGATTLKNMINGFFEVMQSNGYYTALYIYENFLRNYLDTNHTIATYDIWYARYLNAHANYQWSAGSTLPTWSFSYQYPTAFGIWQFGSTSHLAAYGNGTSNIDANIAYRDYPTIMKTYGFNGYSSDGDYGSNASTQYVWITANSLNVRSSPDFASTTNKLGFVYKGERYEVVERASTYTKIMYNGQVAYISANASYVTFTNPNL